MKDGLEFDLDIPKTSEAVDKEGWLDSSDSSLYRYPEPVGGGFSTVRIIDESLTEPGVFHVHRTSGNLKPFDYKIPKEILVNRPKVERA